MNKLLSFIKSNADLFVVFVISIIAFGQYFIDICSGYLTYGKLDSEYLLLSDYAFFKNLIPNRDFTYSYGLLQYYRFENILTLILSYIITPLVITAVFYFLKKIIREKPLLYLSAGFLLVFSVKFIGANAISRYGVLIALSMLFSYLLYRHGKNSKFLLGCMGFILGLAFSLINDQGTYLILSFAMLYFLDDLIRKQLKSFLTFSYYKLTVRSILFVITGFLVGILPLIFYIVLNHAVLEYLRYFSDLSNIVLATKTPFLNFIASPDNLFSLSITTVALFYFFVKLIYFKNKVNLSSYFQLGLVFSILIMEQKSLIRSISGQITFAAFILLIILMYELINNKYFHEFPKKIIIYSIILFSIIFLIGLKGDYLLNFNLREIKDNIAMSLTDTCYTNNVKAFLSKYPSYLTTADVVKKQIDFNGKIFSFPAGNAAFYILFKQKPPFYNSVASDSSLYAQNNSIQYIQKNNIQYVIMPYVASQDYFLDGVPNDIRLSTEFKYILSNFIPVNKSGDYLILAKRNNSDFFNSSILQQVPDYIFSLLNINLSAIPYSEGIYKYRYFTGKALIKTDKVSVVNSFLKTKNVQSLNKIFVLTPNKSLKTGSQNYLNLTTNDGWKTTIHFNACKANKPCIINLSNIPLFYKNRQLSSLMVDNNFKGNIAIYNMNLKILW